MRCRAASSLEWTAWTAAFFFRGHRVSGGGKNGKSKSDRGIHPVKQNFDTFSKWQGREKEKDEDNADAGKGEADGKTGSVFLSPRIPLFLFMLFYALLLLPGLPPEISAGCVPAFKVIALLCSTWFFFSFLAAAFRRRMRPGDLFKTLMMFLLFLMLLYFFGVPGEEPERNAGMGKTDFQDSERVLLLRPKVIIHHPGTTAPEAEEKGNGAP